MARKQHPLYTTWKKMRLRCLSKVNAHYYLYGGRGIKICKRWNDFIVFAHDMGTKPSPSHTLERINNNGNYSPSNCRWATKKEQANNRRSNHRFNGKTLMEWSEILDVKRSTLAQRIYVYKWPIERALTI